MPLTRSSWDVEVAYMDMLANTFMRAPGEAVGTFALECAIDELANELGMTRSNYASATNPTRTDDGHTVFLAQHSRGLSGWRGAVRWSRRAHPGTSRDGEWLGRHGLRNRHLSILPHARRRSTDQDYPRRPRDCRCGRARNGYGYCYRAYAWSPPSGLVCRPKR